MDHHKEGARFRVYNGDAKGTVISINSQNVEYAYDHEPENVWTHSRQWFNSSTFPLESVNG